jgi:iron complex outermembrane recepter protein
MLHDERFRKNQLRLAVVVALGSASVWAADENLQNAAQLPNALQEIIVTAQRREQNINDVGIAISAFDAETIQNLGFHQPSDIAGATSNFTVNTLITDVPNFTIRGVGVNDYALNQATSVGTYVDGIFLSSPALLNFQLFDTERVEVLKGPQGTLYGRNTTGGAVLFISKAPTDTFEASTYDEVGNYGYYLVEGAISGPLSNSVSARLAFNDTQSDGYQKSLTTGRTNGGLDRVNVRAILDWKPVDDLKVRFNFHVGKDRSNLDALNRPGEGSNTSSAGTIDTLDGIPYRDSKADGGSITADWNLGGVTLTSVTGYDYLNRFEFANTDGIPGNVGVGSPPGNERIDQIEQSNIHQVTQELRAASSGHGPLTWVAGLYWSNDEVKDYTIYPVPGAGFPTAAFPGVPTTYPVLTSLGNTYDQKTTSKAVFGQVEWDPADKWHLTGGLRYTRDNKQLDNVTTPFTVNPEVGQGAAAQIGPVESGELFAPASYSKDFSAISGKVGVDYHLSKDALFYASVSKGFKSGGFQGTLIFSPTSIVPFDNETILAYETGAKLTLAGGRVQLNSAIFYYDYKGLQAQGTLKGAGGGVANLFALQDIGNAKNFGGEIDFQAQPTERLNLSLGVGYLDAKIVEPLIQEVRVGGRPAESPTWNANGRARYDIVGTPKMRWFVQSDFRFQTTVNFDIYETPFLKEPGYWVSDGGLGVDAIDGKWKVMLYGRNLADRTYRVFGSTAGVAGNVQEYGPPRTFGVSFSYRFE